MQDGLQEARQFCEALTGNNLEEVLDPGQRQAKYFALSPQRLIVLLRKYRWRICAGHFEMIVTEIQFDEVTDFSSTVLQALNTVQL